MLTTRQLTTLMLILTALIFIDTLSTAYFLLNESAVEFNPIVAAAYEHGWPMFFALKMISLGLVFLLFVWREWPFAQLGMAFCTGLYFVIVAFSWSAYLVL